MTNIESRLAEIRANRERANDMVDRLCGDPSRWTLSVPVRDDDSDMILTQVTDKDLPDFLAAVEAVMALHQPELHCNNPRHTNPDVGCPECAEFCTADGDLYPCRTITDLATALEVQG